ncbi:MAG: succinate dehydrogenase/fumarate reductase cytochrome b subunit [Desulfonatronovibrionaceae bacterium]
MDYAAGFRPGGSGRAAGLDWMQMLSGIALSLFIVLHSFFTASVIIGEEAFNALAKMFEFSYLAQIGGPAVAALFLAHFVLAARKIPFAGREQGIVTRHARMLGHSDTWLWIIQALSGMIILFMGAIHMWVLLNDLPITAVKSAELLHQGLWVWFYVLFIPAVFVHLGAGVYRAGVKWGLVLRSNRRVVKKGLFIFIVLFILLDLVSLTFFYF